MIKSGQAVAGIFVTLDSTGALSAATVVPVGTLYVNGVANAAVVTITGANPYKWALTLPTLAAGDIIQVYIMATVATVATAALVWADVADTKLASDLLGAGAITWTYTLTVAGQPLADAQVWVTTDLAGANIIASGTTNQNGVVTFYLDAGTVYVWCAKSGYSFTNPDTEVVV